jgi:hypothetical protein
MRLNLDMNILRHMSDGVITIDRFGQIMALNKIAEPWAERCEARSSLIKQFIDAERRGQIVFPVALELPDQRNASERESTDAWLCKNGPDDYAIFIVAKKAQPASTPAHQSPRKKQPSMVSMMTDAVRDQLAALRDMLHTKVQAQSMTTGDLMVHCQKVEKLMHEVTDLAKLLDRDDVFAGERLALADIIGNLLIVLPPSPRHVTVSLRASKDATGPIYGDSAWLSYALRLLIDNLVEHAPPHTAIELATQQMGGFVILTGRSAAPSAWYHAVPDQPTETPGTERLGRTASNMQLMMCNRIVELHAGQLRLNRMTDENGAPGNLESFTLTLTTSVPILDRSHVNCEECRHARHELTYAADMADLISSTQTTISDRSLQP